MKWMPPSVGLRVFPVLVIIAILLLPLFIGERVRLPRYTEIPLPADLQSAIDAESPSESASIERQRAQLRRRLLRGESIEELPWALQLELARGRPGDALRLVEEIEQPVVADDTRFLIALAHYERARKLEDPWRDELDLERCVQLCEESWERADFASAAQQLSLWAELGLGSQDSAREQVDPSRQPELWERLREAELLESGPWRSALEAAGSDREQLRRLYRLRPGLYCFWALGWATWDALIAAERQDFATVDSLSVLVHSRIDAISDLPELGLPYEQLLARWVDARPADRGPLQAVRRAREIVMAKLDAQLERELDEELLPKLADARLDVYAVQLHWVRMNAHYRTEPEVGVTMAQEMVRAAERAKDPYLIDMALHQLHVAYSNLPDARRTRQVDLRKTAATGRYGFHPRRELRSQSRSALRVLDYDAAAAAATAQLERSLRAGDPLGRFTAHIDRSYVELMRGHPELALEHSRKARSIAERLPEALGSRADTLIERELGEIVEAQASASLGATEEALETFAATRATYVSEGGRQRILSYLLEADVRERLADFARARDCLAHADSLNTRLGYRDHRWRIPYRRARLAQRQGEFQEALRLYDEAWTIRREYGLDLGGQDLASRFLGGTRDLAEDYLALLFDRKAPASKTLLIDQAERALRWGLASEATPSVATGELLLQFRAGESATTVWCVSADGIVQREIPIGRSQWLQSTADCAARLAAGQPLDDWMLELMRGGLLEALDDLLAAHPDALRIAPAVEMAALPWSKLEWRSERVCAKRTLIITPISRRSRPSTRRAELPMAVLAYAGDGNQILLPGVELHAREFAEGRPAVRLALGSEADPGRALDDAVASRVLVLAGHAGVDAEGTPYLQLASSSDRPSQLHPADLENIDLSHLECVVLIGCGTALEDAREQSAPGFGLAGAFLAAGSQRVLASVVAIPDDWDWTPFVSESIDRILGSSNDEKFCSADPRFILLRN